MEVILASASSRRRKLLLQIGWNPVVVPPAFTEAKTLREAEEKADALGVLREGLASEADLLPLYNSVGKAKSVAGARPQELVIAADTIVVIGSMILGKPRNEKEARAMLRALSGKTHEVKTGVALCFEGQMKTAVVTTEVTFETMSDDDMDEYIASGEPMDKAGAYGIQGRGAAFISSIHGSYSNVVGLPLSVTRKFCEEFMRRGQPLRP